MLRFVIAINARTGKPGILLVNDGNIPNLHINSSNAGQIPSKVDTQEIKKVSYPEWDTINFRSNNPMYLNESGVHIFYQIIAQAEKDWCSNKSQ